MRLSVKLHGISCLVIAAIVMLFSQTTIAQYNYFNLPFNKNRSTLSFENFDNIVIIEALLNDSIPVRLILDSGVEGIIITDMSVVGQLADRCIRNFRISAPGTIEVLEACITSPVIAKIKGLDPAITNLILLSDDYFSLEEYIGTKVHGLIGIDKFKNMVVTTNYDRNLLTFKRPSHYKLPAKGQVIPISINRGKPYVTARVEFDNGTIKDLRLLIDSGANHPLLLENDSLDGYKPQKSVKAVIGKGLAGNMEGSFARVGWLLLGNYRLDNIITSFTDDYLPGSSDLNMNRHGTLGAGALSRFRVTYDYQRERIILQKGSKFSQPFEYNMSGITFRSIGSFFNVFEITDIIPGSPADESGLLPGDILLAIDNKSTFTMNMGEINRLLSAGEGVRVDLQISRDGKHKYIRIRLRKLI
ncbi:MAG: PDZ domain-containing protein [Lentimicrobium sp.]|nr:PDZ domain-containing protein [Lentimicrobium sp.]